MSDSKWIFNIYEMEAHGKAFPREAGSKPSNWIPPGTLLELISPKEFVLLILLRVLCHLFSFVVKITLSILKIDLSAIWIFRDQKLISFDAENFALWFWIECFGHSWKSSFLTFGRFRRNLSKFKYSCRTNWIKNVVSASPSYWTNLIRIQNEFINNLREIFMFDPQKTYLSFNNCFATSSLSIAYCSSSLE